MSMYDDGPEHEPFGPQYVRLANPDCPDCNCCTAVLCAQGRASVLECSGHVDGDAEMIERVTGCPCSTESTRGTLSWRAAMVRAVTFATEKPLRPELESLLTRIAEDEPYAVVAALLPKLTVRRYVRWRPGVAPQLTDFGWAYIGARWGRRSMSAVTVKAVDVGTRTAQVLARAFSGTELVTVPLDQVANSRTGLTADTAGDAVLCAEVNADATAAELVVLTKVCNPALAVAARPDTLDGAR
ncbi:hypothetical protein GTY54_22375 [Streptomyces sp. SID625]|nr:hypothetical protein [Streptomyces sp. SID625]